MQNKATHVIYMYVSQTLILLSNQVKALKWIQLIQLTNFPP